MKDHDFGKSVFYRVACHCGDSDHDLSLEIEAEAVPSMPLHFYGRYNVPNYWRSNNFVSRLFKRISTALKILFVGWVEIEDDFLMMEEKHIDAFIAALEEGKQKIKQTRG
jgi:hypothetical protein